MPLEPSSKTTSSTRLGKVVGLMCRHFGWEERHFLIMFLAVARPESMSGFWDMCLPRPIAENGDWPSWQRVRRSLRYYVGNRRHMDGMNKRRLQHTTIGKELEL